MCKHVVVREVVHLEVVREFSDRRSHPLLALRLHVPSTPVPGHRQRLDDSLGEVEADEACSS